MVHCWGLYLGRQADRLSEFPGNFLAHASRCAVVVDFFLQHCFFCVLIWCCSTFWPKKQIWGIPSAWGLPQLPSHFTFCHLATNFDQKILFFLKRVISHDLVEVYFCFCTWGGGSPLWVSWIPGCAGCGSSPTGAWSKNQPTLCDSSTVNNECRRLDQSSFLAAKSEVHPVHRYRKTQKTPKRTLKPDQRVSNKINYRTTINIKHNINCHQTS